jgi:glycosyltransferase 2 family protein
MTLPLTTLRWAILLRALGISLPFLSLFHFVAIGMVTSMLLPGTTGGDAVRGVYAWRAAGGSGGRIGLSILADRMLALFSVLSIPLVFSVFNWKRMQQTPHLTTLSMSLMLTAGACIIGAFIVFVAPRFIQSVEVLLFRWPTLAGLLGKLRDVIVMLRANPLRLLAAFMLAVATQILTVFAVILIGNAIAIDHLSIADYMFAVPLTVIANALPLTPSGIGIGEAAFGQICRWLEPMSSGAAYSSIFFAFRLVSMFICLPGIISLVVYRNSVPRSRENAQAYPTAPPASGCPR